MSAISGISSQGSYGTSGPDPFSELTSGEFLRIIFTELANQDPFEPNDSQAMLEQLATIRSIEADTQLSNKLSSLVSQSEFAAATGLIGSLVSGVTLDNRRVSDLVISVSMTDRGPVLNLFDGSRMFFSNVDEVVGPLDPPPTEPPDDGDGDGNGKKNRFDFPNGATAPPIRPDGATPADPVTESPKKSKSLQSPAGR